ncbi:hypothetical protein LMG28688_05511 [Paraburkholderia caffeinitolerans]|uniref:Stress-response A/B barrel domain-containing protein n=1 Tax=Paraburkholderia caffeinitolerans TaxID=1723730 RepID=A0A6J5GNB0_9BURK|nr:MULTISPECIES: Dabb family protein [Paraburkholderia]CAB3802119.1 hypothetical protein LMG28688_05511 [Paraburkholderia caffeinitolerans]
MQHKTARIFITPDADAEAIEQALRASLRKRFGLNRVNFERNLAGSWGAGDYTLDLVSHHDHAEWDAAANELASIPGIARVDHVAYKSIGGGVRQPGLRDGVWRTLMFRARPNAHEKDIRELEFELLRMPAYMRGIRNWRLSRVVTPGTWTHVWQQEFVDMGDLAGEYLLHPFHWGWVDRRFDAEHPQWTVDAISHAACPLASSLLADDAI